MSIQQMFKGIRFCPPSVSPPTELPPPRKVLLALSQHAGQVCEPLVEEGQNVVAGEAVAKDAQSGQPAVFASIGGTVEGLVQTCDPTGQPVQAVAIAAAEEQGAAEAGLPVVAAADLAEMKPGEVLARLDAAGLYLTPSCGPRRYISMNGIENIRGIHTLLIKAVDADPPVMPNQAALYASGQELELGIKALQQATGAEGVMIAVPKGGSSPELEEMARDNRWQLAPVPAGAFPYATDTLLIKLLTGREVATPDGDPRDVGVVIQSLRTALAVGATLSSGRPVTHQIVTVAGDVATPQSFWVPLGTPLSELIQEAGGLAGEPGKVMLGGPMMGWAQYDLSAPVTFATDGVFVQSAANLAKYRNHPCIHCGRCVQVCPVNLVPSDLGKLCEFGQYDTAAERDLFHCIECGCCAYVCPAKRPLVQLMRLGKHEVLAMGMES